MSEKPSIPFAETVALLLKNAGVNADEQLSRTLAMAIAIKFQETQAERDEAIWQQAAERIRALAPTPPGMVCVPMDSIPQIAADAMQGEWNEICSDTACYPLDIKTVGKGGILRFAPGHWARAVGENVRRAMLAAAPSVKE